MTREGYEKAVLAFMIIAAIAEIVTIIWALVIPKAAPRHYFLAPILALIAAIALGVAFIVYAAKNGNDVRYLPSATGTLNANHHVGYSFWLAVVAFIFMILATLLGFAATKRHNDELRPATKVFFSKICELSSEMFYDGLLECATEEVANRTIERFDEEMDNNGGKEEILPRDLKNLILSSDISDSVIFIDTLSRSSESDSFAQLMSSTSSKCNKGEVDIISRLCQIYLSAGFSSSSIGAMSTYRNQVDELRKGTLPSSIETNTVDQYQGRDKDIILISLVHTSASDSDYCNESLLSERRVNVALTRAKKKLIIVGCMESLSAFPLMKKMIAKIGNVYKFYA
uniref:DNA replication ATP-dependent helicase/nuclease n=1 Tax=Panagrolaimus sp. ES5 TaxID=591445 RepID=A0AC34FCE0_9BILA